MKMKTVAALAAVSLFVTGCAKNFAAIPIAGPGQQVRYTQGFPTVSSNKALGSVQITPLGYIADDNRFVFGAAAFNKSRIPANFGLNSVAVSTRNRPLKTYTRDQLAHEAKVKAVWASVAVALAGAAAAYSANQNAYRTTNGYVSGPGGTATFSATTYDPALAYAGTAAAAAGTGYALASINSSLDNTISHLNGSVLQVNTVDPGQSAGGEIVIDMPKAKEFPQPLDIAINWNGEVHTFAFTLSEAAK